MPADFRKEKLQETIHELASTFISHESNRTSMITVTKVIAEEDFKKVVIFVTVFPDDQERAAMDFLKRQRSEFKEFAKHSDRLARLPLFDFEIDKGEKARQRIEQISLNLKGGSTEELDGTIISEEEK